jgi:hypothetical protein
MLMQRLAVRALAWASVLISAGLAEPVAGQAVGPFNGRLIPTGVDTLEGVLLRNGTARPTRFTRSELSIVARASGDTVLRRVTQWLGGAARDSIERTDTLWVALPSLTPLAYRAVGGGDDDSLTWAGGRVRGHTMTPAPATREAVDAESKGDVYLFAGLELLARSAPLTAKYKARAQMFDPAFGTGRVDLEVKGDGRTPSGAEYWIVQTEFAHIPQRFYVEKTTRRLAGSQMALGSGAYLSTTATWATRTSGAPPP